MKYSYILPLILSLSLFSSIQADEYDDTWYDEDTTIKEESSVNPSKGFYIGAGYGVSTYRDGGYISDIEKEHNIQTLLKNYDTSGYKLYLGYQFNRVVAIEGSYTNYGKFTVEDSYFDGEIVALSPTSISLAANVGYSFGQYAEYRPFIIMGLSRMEMNEDGYVNVFRESSGNSLRMGLGFEYAPYESNGLGLRIAYEQDDFTLSEEKVTDASKTYKQNFSLAYFGVQYKF